ncbi:major facilitator superfamily domain-containing protein rtet [Oratosquilla oratoria]|uniref:major facilitator superfamily domain-containing protein rtet n=1 Tax=Oratosquilla oratoria TaxID=337810 RepID=UPI003F776CA0
MTSRAGIKPEGETKNLLQSQEMAKDGKPKPHVNGENNIDSSDTKVSKSDERKTHPMQIVTFLSLLLDLLGFTVILPLFPALLDYYAQHDTSGLYSFLLGGIAAFQDYLKVPFRFNSVLFGGLLGSLFSFLQFLSSPVTGALSDVYGRKPVLCCTLVGIAVSYGTWAFASNFAIFVLARILGGVSKGNVSLAYSIMADVSHASNRAKGMALVGIAFSIGFIIGPAVGALFSKWGSSGWFQVSALYAFTLAVLNIIYFSIFFKETLPKEQRRPSIGSGLNKAWTFISPRALFSFSAVQGLEKKEQLKLIHLGGVYFAYILLYSGLEFTLTFVTHLHHDFNSLAQGRMFAYLGIVMATVQGGYVRKIKAGGEKDMACKGLILMIPSFFIVGVSSTVLGLYFGLTLYAIGSAIMVPCLTALAASYGPKDQKGTIMGIFRSLGALARAIGPIFASIAFWCIGASWCYCIGGALLILPFCALLTF